jgi:hypothetical protein
MDGKRGSVARLAFRVNGPGVLANNLVTDGQP